MSVLFADNFSIYGATAALMLNGIYAEIGATGLSADPDGVSPGHVAWIGNSFWGNIRRVLPVLEDSIGMCGRIWFTALPSVATNLGNNPFVIYDPAGVALACLNIDNTGRINARSSSGGGGAVLGSTPSPAITATGWYHIEVLFTQGGVAGSAVEVRVEGITVLTLDGVTFANNNQIASVGSVQNHAASVTDWYFKDFVIWDTNGAQNNDFLGSVLVTNLTPTADEALNWTPVGAAVGWSILAGIPPDDAKYIEADVGPPLPDPYVADLSDLPVASTTVKALITFVRAAKTDGGDGFMQVGVISGANTSLGANRPITIAQTYWQDVFELDPATDALWTPGAVNAAQLQIDRTA